MQAPFVFKYGGHAMTDPLTRRELLTTMRQLQAGGTPLVIVHGGGPFIREALETAGIDAPFHDGQRITSPEAMAHVRAALGGTVNAILVNTLNAVGCAAVGLTGSDAGLVSARKRMGRRTVDGTTVDVDVDLGRVGDVDEVRPRILLDLLRSGYTPVVASVSPDAAGEDLNINADVFAGHLAGALHARSFVLLTDVDGLYRDIDDPGSRIPHVRLTEVDDLIDDGVIAGGMIPKFEACRTALEQGAQRVRILNGTCPDHILRLTDDDPDVGTLITHR